MKKISKKARVRIVMIICAALVICCAASVTAAIAQLSDFNRIQSENSNYEIALMSDEKNVRQLPFAVSASTGKAEKDQSIKILAEKNGWLKIMYNNHRELETGFVKSDTVYERQKEQVPAETIDLDTSQITAKVGETVSIEAKIFPRSSTEKINWSSSDENVAKVQEANVTITGEGTAVITAKTEKCVRTIDITAVQSNPELSFSEKSYTLNLNEKLNLKKDLKASSKEIKWESSNSQVISVNDGVVKALKSGAAVITASIDGATTSCRVYIKNANSHADKPLNLQNAYGNIYNYHPSVCYFENGFNGYKYWCAYTPYEGNNDYWENPHIQVSNDLKNWTVPKGFSNPLEPVPSNYEHGRVYNSDTELVYNTDTKTLECWWRFYDYPNNRTVLKRKTTKDGVHWSNSEEMLSGELYKYDFLSPAIIYENGTYKMWAINQNTGHSLDYRESKNGKDWGKLRQIKITYKDKELANWHLDVIHTAKGYEALISAYYPKENDRTHMDLYYSYSQDNINYTTAEKIFSPSSSSNAFDNRGLYRSSFLYANGRYYMFYSALNKKTGPTGVGLICGRDVYTMG